MIRGSVSRWWGWWYADIYEDYTDIFEGRTLLNSKKFRNWDEAIGFANREVVGRRRATDRRKAAYIAKEAWSGIFGEEE